MFVEPKAQKAKVRPNQITSAPCDLNLRGITLVLVGDPSGPRYTYFIEQSKGSRALSVKTSPVILQVRGPRPCD